MSTSLLAFVREELSIGHEAHFSITVLIALLLIASGVAMATKWVRLPYTLALVIVGLVISPMHFLPVVHVSPELILLIFLPALLFEAAWNLKIDHLRENLLPILTMATAGVGLSVGIIGTILHFGIGLEWGQALLFGAIISATDPVSVLALFKKLGAPERLTIIVEGESLFNDGTAVVVFRILLGIVAGTTAFDSTGQLIFSSLREFSVVVFGGIAVGAIIGIIASTLTSYFDDHLLEITLTTIVAYGSFLLAEEMHVSPVIAVLIAGLILGNYGRQKGMSPTTQVAVNSFWEYAAFVVNSLVFLLIGLEIQIGTLANATAIAWAVAAMLIARLVCVYGLIALMNLRAEPVPFKWQHVLFWGGLRGSLSIALVLSLPVTLPGRQMLVAMVFGAVIFSMLAQGLRISPLLRWLRISAAPQELKSYEMARGKLLAETAALAELDQLRSQGLVTERVYRAMQPALTRSQEELSQRLSELDVADIDVDRQLKTQISRHLIAAKKTRLTTLLRDGLLSEETWGELNEALDEELADLRDESNLSEMRREAVESA
ncbi:MAG: Na+/H+ antiporter [Acidobacteria bacterium]|nr:Na+/H+ antiporter [Acidobacteriota bacterium]